MWAGCGWAGDYAGDPLLTCEGAREFNNAAQSRINVYFRDLMGGGSSQYVSFKNGDFLYSDPGFLPSSDPENMSLVNASIGSSPSVLPYIAVVAVPTALGDVSSYAALDYAVEVTASNCIGLYREQKRGTSAANNSIVSSFAGTHTVRNEMLGSFAGAHVVRVSVNLTFAGTYVINKEYVGAFAGITRHARTVDGGWAVWVGDEAPPDLDAAPNTIAQSLPVTLALAPPVSGTKDYYVVVRRANEYGLHSQNQKPKIITIDEFGELILAALPTPQNMIAFPQFGLKIVVGSQWQTTPVMDDPPDLWYVWITAAPITVGVDAPLAAFPATNSFKTVYNGPYAIGTWYVATALYRAADGTFSLPLESTVVIPGAPDAPGDVHSPDAID